MSSTVPTQLQGSHSPNSLEILWERHRSKVKALFWIAALGLAAYYGLRYYEQKQRDAEWAKFAQGVLLGQVYEPEDTNLMQGSPQELLHRYEQALANASQADLEQSLASAAAVGKPYLMWTLANKAVRAGDWAMARNTLVDLRTEFPDHPLCVESKFPVQVRPTKPIDKDEEPDKNPQRTRTHDELYEPAVAGSAVSRLLAEIEKAASFELPTTFAKPEIPADAPRYRIQLSGEYGEFTIALMTEAAPEHCALFEKLVEEKFWDGIKIDEINRAGSNAQWYRNEGAQFHFGFESTRTELDRTKWDTSKPSEEERVVEEFTGLGNFPGAVSARSQQGKSEVERLWICADDRADQDGFRQVFAYVVEGLEKVRMICEADFARSEDEQFGRGKPAENISIESITKVE